MPESIIEVIETEERLVAAQLLGREPQDRQTLNLPIAELVVMIAQAVVVPIIAHFIDGRLTERYRNARSRDEQKEVRGELAAYRVEIVVDPPTEDLRMQLVDDLEREGVGRDAAERIIDATISRVRTKVTASGFRQPR